MGESGARERRTSGSSGRRRSSSGGARPATRALMYEADCAVCGRHLERGDRARLNGRTATCVACLEGVAVDGAEAGVAGESARREGVRRRQAQQARGKGDVGGLWGRVARIGRPARDAGSSWATGAAGEQQLGRLLDTLANDGAIAVLHDRAVPRSRANLDHLVVAASDVWVIDAKKYRGRVEVVDVGSIVRPELKLRVDGRDLTTKLVERGRWQAEQVRSALDPTYSDVPVHRALCFVDAKRRLGHKAHMIEGVLVSWEKDIARRLRQPGPLDERFRAAIQRHLATRFRPAAGAAG
jgi:hypothetical protein